MASDGAHITEPVEERPEARPGPSTSPTPVTSDDSAATTTSMPSPSPPVDEKGDSKNDMLAQEEPIATASLPPTAVQPQPPKEKKSPFLLKPEYKTALKDFIVCHPDAEDRSICLW